MGSYKQKMFFSGITTNSDWEILTKSLLLLKDGMGYGVKDEKF